MNRSRPAFLGAFMLATVLFGAAACDTIDVPSGNPDAATLFVGFVDCGKVTPAVTVNWYLGVPPVDVTIATNQIVRFVVTDAYAHTISSGVSPTSDEIFGVAIDAETPQCVQFVTAADYPFFCQVHPAMTGVIHVRK